VSRGVQPRKLKLLPFQGWITGKDFFNLFVGCSIDHGGDFVNTYPGASNHRLPASAICSGE
jgi:hypothetical protein